MTLTDALYRLYWSLERRIAPGVRYAQGDYEDRLDQAVSTGCHWLDLGCGHQLLPEWRTSQERELTARPASLVGIDPEYEAVARHRTIPNRACGDAGALPFRDESFDLVTANMVVEHLKDPSRQFAEIARVLRPGGRFLFHTPNAHGYPTLMARAVPDAVRGMAARIIERRPSEDRFPTFYRANTPTAIAGAAAAAGMRVEDIRFVRSNAMFWFLAPIAVFELLFLRMLGREHFAGLRPNLIVTLVR